MSKKKKIAIACQGGGTHTAFTAGVLNRLFQRGINEKYEIVGLSGTSGGALCATSVWVDLLQAKKQSNKGFPFCKKLMELWHANTATLPVEKYINNSNVAVARNQTKGFSPAFYTSPYQLQWLVDLTILLSPRPEFFDFKKLLEDYIPFEIIPLLTEKNSPQLLLGAADILNGTFKAFDSTKEIINVDKVIASASIPNLFEALEIGKNAYWDGLFSENPPVTQFMSVDGEIVDGDKRADELWVVLVNPKTRDSIPKSPQDITDRRNELSGNLSLFSGLDYIQTMSGWIVKEYPPMFSKEIMREKDLTNRPMQVRFISMSSELVDSLDYTSKLDRKPALINELIEDGEKQADEFVLEPDVEPETDLDIERYLNVGHFGALPSMKRFAALYRSYKKKGSKTMAGAVAPSTN